MGTCSEHAAYVEFVEIGCQGNEIDCHDDPFC